MDFMSGSCHLYAILKNRELENNRFLVLLDRTEKYSEGIYAVNHVYALTEENKAIDSIGIHNPDNIISQFMNSDDFVLQDIIDDSNEDVEDIIGNMHTNEYGGRCDPIVIVLYGEDELQHYVASSKDDWTRPLEYYDEEDLSKAKEIMYNKKLPHKSKNNFNL